MVIVAADGSSYETLKGSEAMTTNNRMELTATIKALRFLKQAHEVSLFTDSTYVKNGITRWIHEWKQSGWVTRDKTPVKNRDLWETLDREMQRHRITWKWVKGHSGNKWNELADQLATGYLKEQIVSSENTEAVHLYPGITCRHASGKGAWAMILKYKQHVKVLGGKAEQTTANRLYLETAINGFKALKRPTPVCLYTSSGYLKDGATVWVKRWKNSGWKTREGKEVSNKEQWQELQEFVENLNVKIILVDKKSVPCLLQESKEIAKENMEHG